MAPHTGPKCIRDDQAFPDSEAWHALLTVRGSSGMMHRCLSMYMISTNNHLRKNVPTWVLTTMRDTPEA
eukprot:3251727-Amphidinium_carterae.1